VRVSWAAMKPLWKAKSPFGGYASLRIDPALVYQLEQLRVVRMGSIA
jgi:hypothetical protein